MSFLQLSVPMPPSDNHLYINTPRGRAKTAAAKKYKSDVQRKTAEACLVTGTSFDGTKVHLIALDFYYTREEVFSKQAWRPFLKNDASNRQKLLIDAVTEGSGFDDGALFFYLLRKNISQDGITYVDVTLRLLTEDVLLRWNEFWDYVMEKPNEPGTYANLGFDSVGP